MRNSNQRSGLPREKADRQTRVRARITKREISEVGQAECLRRIDGLYVRECVVEFVGYVWPAIGRLCPKSLTLPLRRPSRIIESGNDAGNPTSAITQLRSEWAKGSEPALEMLITIV